MANPTTTLQGLCRLLNDITPRRVQQLVIEGALPKPEKAGEYDLVECTRRYIAFLQKGAQGDALSAHRTRLAKTKADMAEIESARLSGEMVSASETLHAWALKENNTRMRLLAIPAKLASRIRMATSAVEAQAMMRKEINEALEELAKAKVTRDRAPVRVKQDADDDGEAVAAGVDAAARTDDQPVG